MADNDDLYADLCGLSRVTEMIAKSADADAEPETSYNEPEPIKSTSTAKTESAPAQSYSQQFSTGQNDQRGDSYSNYNNHQQSQPRQNSPPSQSYQNDRQSNNNNFNNNNYNNRNEGRSESQPVTRLNNPNLPPAGTRADIPEAARIDDGKMFIGGLSWDTTDEGLVAYFERFGKVASATVMREPGSGRSRGFAFLTFQDPASVNEVMVRDHFLDGKSIDPKRAIPRKEEARTDKLFVRNIPPGVTQPQFQDFFQQYGILTDCTLMMDRDTNTHRGFGFVTYKTEETVDRVVNGQPYTMNGQQIEVKKSSARDGAGGGGRGGRFDRNNDRGGGGGNFNQNHNFGGNNMNPMMGNMMNGFDPQAMAEYFKSMGWGSFNPAMMWNPMIFGGMQNPQGGAAGGGGPSANFGNSGGPQSRSRDRGPPSDGPSGGRASDNNRSNQGGAARSSRDDKRYEPYGRN